ncbi:response regulator receiver domain [Palleronia sp. LCG004]|uniref:response regulator receiver domain n=1 Tax=Palleronia sp. LCG004 TaxID=3079304 RepID=UPI002943775F|nr:response regulator receiver domain [Palleronia sp. LCG004]WOI56715.1 response regulator receiver domain [Palleronia sp. LCG004]
MTEAATFSSLIHEAFIEPLRSVLIVDDQYPTWEEILNSKMEGGAQNKALEERSVGKEWVKKNPSEPLAIIKEFRDQKPGFVIDIHDALAPTPAEVVSGTSPQESASELASHLHQSDLLVLDYNLEGDAGGLGGAKAREILRMVLANKHFNLVLLHTGEDDLDKVMTECLISLMQSCTSLFDEKVQQGLAGLDETLDELEVEGTFDRSKLREFFPDDLYLAIRNPKLASRDVFGEFMQGKGLLADLHGWGDGIGLKGGQLRSFVDWAIRESERPRLDEFNGATVEGLSWNANADQKWLRTSKGFVAFVKKGPGDLLKELQEALEDWKPTPSRLLSAKYRYELNSVGVAAEDKSLAKASVFAQFYDGIREPTRDGVLPEQAKLSREFKLKEHVARQSEAIAFLIEDEIVNFGEKIVQADEATDDTFASHYGVDLKDEGIKRDAVNQYNSYVSTLPQKAGDAQLDSGHILKQANGDWWICATPACDLQPGQNTIAFGGDGRSLRPFTAMRLVPIKADDMDSDHINSGSYCFIEDLEAKKVLCLGLRTTADETKPATQKVTWRTFVAKNQGLITGGKCTVILPRLGDTKIELPEEDLTLVAKLRYEYALNFIQRVGSSVSRIGLGYASYPNKPATE